MKKRLKLYIMDIFNSRLISIHSMYIYMTEHNVLIQLYLSVLNKSKDGRKEKAAVESDKLYIYI